MALTSMLLWVLFLTFQHPFDCKHDFLCRCIYDNYDGFAYIDNVKVEETLSAAEFNPNTVSHFYNKNRDELVLNSSAVAFSNVSVYNLSGQLVLNQSLINQKETVDFSKVSNGIYLVTLSIGNTAKTIKNLKNYFIILKNIKPLKT